MGISKKQTAELYLFELVERTSRFYVHLDEIERQFYFGANSKVEDKLIFIQSYKDCLLKIILISTKISSELEKIEEGSELVDKCLKSIREAIISLNLLHRNHLNHLPRPSEPIELRRFSRIIDKHVIKLNKEASKYRKNTKNKKQTKRISIYVSEDIGDEVYAKDPLSEFKNKELNDIINIFNQDFTKAKIGLFESPKSLSDTIHITIPRIDTNNPCRWPTLIHELGHNIIHEDFFQTGKLKTDFEAILIEEQKQVIAAIEQKNVNIESWLLECWCDLFACVVFGPAFWFSQYSSFIFEIGNNFNARYPKPLFRLRLIHNILLHRFSGTLFKELKDTIELGQSVFEHFDDLDATGFNNDEDIREVFIYFRDFFRKYFSKNIDEKTQFGTDILNKKLSPLIKYTDEIEESTIRDLVESLELGLPISSKRSKPDKLAEKPNYVQEILLAAWFFRNNNLKSDVLNGLRKLSSVKKNEIAKNYENSLLKSFKRFDQSILRSIQVSEWFDLFYDPEKIAEIDSLENDILEKLNTGTKPKNQFVDIEIYQLIKSNKLKISPIINLKEQLGATSFDLRLGTSFQLYYQTKYGIVDFSEEQTLKSLELNSNLVDLDFLESITISPGQFILGHTMEYIKLPENISAEIEGRSSFARLGLEIHMTAGFIDPGFEGVITLEIYNAGPNPIKLFPGIRVAQLKFIPISKPNKPYNKKDDAKYKGLMSLHTSMQFKDYEITRIKNARKKLIE